MLFEIFMNQKAMAIKSFKPLKIHAALKQKKKGRSSKRLMLYNEWKGKKKSNLRQEKCLGITRASGRMLEK